MLSNQFSNIKENNSSFLKRFYIYQKERFSFLGHGLIVTSFSFSAISYSRICRGATGFINTNIFIAGIFITISLFFLVRIFDEFKDADDDAKFRSDLPVPRGLISLLELGSIAVIIIIFQIIVILLFFSQMIVFYLIVMFYLLLMGKEFFIPDWLKRHRFWYVTSHMFIIPLVDMYASGLDWKLSNVNPPKGLIFFFAVSYMNGVVLEIGRKIRIPQNESEGVLTYSALLGVNKATYLWIFILIITLILSIIASAFAGYGRIIFIILTGCFFLCSFPAFAFLFKKSKKLSKTIEYASALWTIAMYLTLGGGPIISKFFFK